MSAVALETWHRFDISSVDDLRNAVFDAELEAIQLPAGRVHGSLAFAARDGIVFSSGLIHGHALVTGAISGDAMTLGVGLRIGTGSLFWLSHVMDGDVVVILPGGKCDVLFNGTSLYVTATLTAKQLQREAEQEGLVINRSLIRRTGLHAEPIEPDALAALSEQVESLHASGDIRDKRLEIGRRMLRTLVSHYARLPDRGGGRVRPVGQAMIVRKARDYIRRHLSTAISVDDVASATQTSPRTLFRAFSETLGDTPHHHVRRLRLHRIRRELLSSNAATVALAAQKWGIPGDMGRLAKDYRDLFGENPSATLALGRALQRGDLPV
ncbi:helix-turn-helix domain-containing protein [Bradyrhizobium sp. USDA 3364]